MRMNTWLKSVLLVLIVAAAGQAKLRARYCYPPNHDPDAAGQGAAPYGYTLSWLSKIYPGIWEGSDESTGFDGVGDRGDLSQAPYVSAEYWVDSLFASSVYEDRKDAPLLDGWASPMDLLDTSYSFAGDAYVTLAAGGLKIDQAGAYEFSLSADDGMMLWVDKNGNGVIDVAAQSDTAEAVAECLAGHLRYDSTGAPWAWGFANDTTVSVTFDSPGLYRIVAWYWDHSEVGYMELTWKKPGGDFEPISGTNGDLGDATGGLPGIRIVSLEVDGVDKPSNEWSNVTVDACAPVTFTAETSNMRGVDPVFVWDFFGDGSVVCTTTEASVTYKYAYDPDVFVITPEVMVRRGHTYSLPSSEQDVIFVFVTGTQQTCDNSQLPCITPITTDTRATRVSAHSRLLVRGGCLRLPVPGMHVRINDLAGRQTAWSGFVSGSSLDVSPLSPGSYVVRAHGHGWHIAAPLHVMSR